jgi:dephospho-CoA kinase
MTFLVGLTGGIGSGKSTVAQLFAALGAAVIDTDAISHALTGPEGEAIAAIRKAFGRQVIDSTGALDRVAMRQLAFADPNVRRRLEAILHPLVRSEADRQVAAHKAPYAMVVAPLLVESGMYRYRVSRILVVDCEESLQVARTVARSGLTEQEVRAIMAAQASRATRLAAADDVIENNGTVDQVHTQVARLHDRYMTLASCRT